MRPLRNQRQNHFLVLVHFHRIVIREFSLVSEVFDVVSENILQMIQAFFNYKRQENFNRGSEFMRQIIDVILIIPFVDYHFAVLIDAEVFGIEFFFPELPEFFKVFQFSLCISGSGRRRKFLLESVPMKKSPPPFFRDSLRGLDTWFASEYGRELQELDRSNFHARATDLLDLQNGDIHVDLCADPAHFLAPLKQKQQGAIIIGIEESAVMIKKAVDFIVYLSSSMKIILSLTSLGEILYFLNISFAFSD